MEPEKEKWINDVLGSLDNLERAEPNPFLFAKIRNRLSTPPSKIYVSTRVVWGISASFTLLLLLNFQAINQIVTPSISKTTDLNAVVSEMQLYPANNQLYGVWSGQNY